MKSGIGEDKACRLVPYSGQEKCLATLDFSKPLPRMVCKPGIAIGGVYYDAPELVSFQNRTVFAHLSDDLRNARVTDLSGKLICVALPDELRIPELDNAREQLHTGAMG